MFAHRIFSRALTVRKWILIISRLSDQTERVSVAYHKKNRWIKCMRQQPCCMRYIVGVPIFKHLQAKRMLKFIVSVVNSSSLCLLIHKHYFRFLSLISTDIKHFFRVKCDIFDFYENTMCALYARIDFVQRA